MRLTNKIDNHYHIIHNWSARNTFEDQNKEDFAIQKLGQLEDIEDELGIDLTTLFKALKNGCWIKHKKTWETKYKIEYFEPDEFAICFHNDMIMFCQVRYYGDESGWGRSIEIEGDYHETHYFGTSNYGKTWALTKEELL